MISVTNTVPIGTTLGADGPAGAVGVGIGVGTAVGVGVAGARGVDVAIGVGTKPGPPPLLSPAMTGFGVEVGVGSGVGTGVGVDVGRVVGVDMGRVVGVGIAAVVAPTEASTVEGIPGVAGADGRASTVAWTAAATVASTFGVGATSGVGAALAQATRVSNIRETPSLSISILAILAFWGKSSIKRDEVGKVKSRGNQRPPAAPGAKVTGISWWDAEPLRGHSSLVRAIGMD